MMGETRNVVKLTKLMLAIVAGITLLISSFVMAESAKARLEMTLFSNPWYMNPNFKNVDESTSVKGFLKDVSSNGIGNREILIYVNNILMDKTRTDSKGCFYFNSWNNTQLKSLVDKAEGQHLSMLPVKIRAVFNGDHDYERSMGYRKSVINLIGVSVGAQFAQVIQPKNGSYELRLTVSVGESADLPIRIAFPPAGATNVTLQLFAVPCTVQASVIPTIIDLKYTANAVIHITTDSVAKAGDYTLRIGILERTQLRTLEPIHLTIKSKP